MEIVGYIYYALVVACLAFAILNVLNAKEIVNMQYVFKTRQDDEPININYCIWLMAYLATIIVILMGLATSQWWLFALITLCLFLPKRGLKKFVTTQIVITLLLTFAIVNRFQFHLFC